MKLLDQWVVRRRGYLIGFYRASHATEVDIALSAGIVMVRRKVDDDLIPVGSCTASLHHSHSACHPEASLKRTEARGEMFQLRGG